MFPAHAGLILRRRAAKHGKGDVRMLRVLSSQTVTRLVVSHVFLLL